MHTTFLAALLEFSPTPLSMCAAGVLLFIVGLWAAKDDLARARGLDKFVALSNLSFAIPLAVFGALHLADVTLVIGGVPSYLPWHLFWAYFVGAALLAASLSIATKIQVRWSGLLLGIMMFLFVFASGGWLLAANAMRGPHRSKLISVGRVVIGITAIFYGVEHFLHPAACPGVPLEKLTPAWIPGRFLIGYLTGAILVIAGACILLAKKTRMAATYLGTWIVLLVLFVYGPILIAALLDPSTAVKIEGINYFADTLLFAGTILALASVTPPEPAGALRRHDAIISQRSSA
jgi:uncharacterized membrane protein